MNRLFGAIVYMSCSSLPLAPPTLTMTFEHRVHKHGATVSVEHNHGFVEATWKLSLSSHRIYLNADDAVTVAKLKDQG